MFAVSTRAARLYDSVAYRASDVFVFGSETLGLPPEVIAYFESGHRIRIPMQHASRSLNLANAVAVVLFEAWRQLGFTAVDDNKMT
jgi:tRNA (cytidine/uridine-2'-O-)-methyltransferase